MKKLLVVIDYQVDFVSGSLGFPEGVSLEGPICKKIEEYKKDGKDVMFTFDTHTENYRETQEGKRLPIPHCIKGTPGHKLYGKVADYCDDSAYILEKTTFGWIGIGEFVAVGGYDEVEFVGVVTDICVLSNAAITKAMAPEVRIIVDASCVATADSMKQKEALSMMESIHVDVINR